MYEDIEICENCYYFNEFFENDKGECLCGDNDIHGVYPEDSCHCFDSNDDDSECEGNPNIDYISEEEKQENLEFEQNRLNAFRNFTRDLRVSGFSKNEIDRIYNNRKLCYDGISISGDMVYACPKCNKDLNLKYSYNFVWDNEIFFIVGESDTIMLNYNSISMFTIEDEGYFDVSSSQLPKNHSHKNGDILNFEAKFSCYFKCDYEENLIVISPDEAENYHGLQIFPFTFESGKEILCVREKDYVDDSIELDPNWGTENYVESV